MGGIGGPIDVIRGKNQTPMNEPREENDLILLKNNICYIYN